MNYTKEMQDAGIRPEIGMHALYEGEDGIEIEVLVIGFKTNNAIVFEYLTGTLRGSVDALVSSRGNFKIKPIDTRTDTEKAVDSLEESYALWHETTTEKSTAKWLLDDIKGGKITGVKWVGND